MWLEGWSPQNSNLWKIQLVTDPQKASEVQNLFLTVFDVPIILNHTKHNSSV